MQSHPKAVLTWPPMPVWATLKAPCNGPRPRTSADNELGSYGAMARYMRRTTTAPSPR